jgi:AraC-like DNA-binding protein
MGVEYIENHYDDVTFSRDDLAHVLNISPAYVSRIFLRELGISPWDYLTRVRMEHARTLLLAPESRSVTEIALRVGYTDPAYFSRTFRRYTGRSPQAFRHSSRAADAP